MLNRRIEEIVEKDLPRISSQLEDKANEVDLEIERERINNLIAIPDGSTTNDTRLEDIKVGANGFSYSSPGDAVRFQLKDISNGLKKITDNVIITDIKNIFNVANVTQGKVLSNGVLIDNVGYGTSDFIEVASNTQYISRYLEYASEYDVYKKYIGRVTGGGHSIPFTTNNNCRYIRFSFNLALSWRTCITNLGNVLLSTTDKVIKEVLIPNLINNDKITYIELTIKKDGTGNFNSIKQANASITDNSNRKIYNLKIYDGVYEEYDFRLKDYVNLIGVNRETCIIKGYQTPNSSDADITNKSTIDIDKNHILKNLTITAQNLRYPVHSESGGNFKDWTQQVINCHIEHFGNDEAVKWRTDNPSSGLLPSNVWESVTAWGYGSSSGATGIYKDSTFKSPHIAWYVHNNNSFEKPSIHYIDNCQLLTTGKESRTALCTESLGGATMCDKVYINNSEMNGDIWQNGVSNKIQIVGSGNTPVACYGNRNFKFLDNEIEILNNSGSDIEANMIVCYNTSIQSIRKMTSNDGKHILCGLTASVIPNGKTGRVFTSGIIPFPNAMFGAKYIIDSVSNGVIIKSTGLVDETKVLAYAIKGDQLKLNK